MQRLIAVSAALAILAFSVLGYTSFAQSVGDPLKISDHGTTCAVASTGNAVECIGKLSGLGSATTNIEVTANFTCTNKAGNTVVGQSAGSSGPITPQNGQVTFDVTTAAVSDKCTSADGHTATFGPTATINVFQGGQLVFTEQIPISQ